ncbi:MAG: hypothetical protein AAFN10_12580 [Bacteroidota bacterium]
MKIYVKLLLLLLVGGLTFAFAPADDIIGTYGVGANNPSQIELSLHADHSFSYQDYSNPTNQIDATGRWEIQRSKIVLLDYDPQLSIHNKWKIEQQGMLAKSRKGLSFYTLHRLGE